MKSVPYGEIIKETWTSDILGLLIGLLSMFAWTALLIYLFAPFIFSEFMTILKTN